MKQYITEEEAIYQDEYHGQFSRKLAKWAISKMQTKDQGSDRMKPVQSRSVDDVVEILKSNGVDIPDQYIYTAWYLYMMAVADYPKSLATDKQRAQYVEETLMDPDGDPSNVLACFAAKMCNAGVPILWERFV